ncbi:MAG TPA: pseudouridine-5'-phosphate glycosidase [Pyrinomonadaceae bacterium]|nr:pseudouridine-5'-phosphate glycosidase [Pyrinomonadaceae bacterium]
MIEIAPNVATARSVVALESTVIAHGLPRPTNLQTAQRLEKIVRESGAVPATIGVLAGKLKVGLNPAEIQKLAEEDNIRKVSTRDLPVAVAELWDGATTVATTCWIAQRAGIKVFATGGIGGVHRGSLPDVSADLPELARTPIVVVCSGAKVVLDLPATREWLETHGVTVVGYGCEEFPAFYSRSSGLPVDARANSPADVVALFRAQRALGINSALLVTVPVPEESEVPQEQLLTVLDEALESAARNGIGGRELTPFLLTQMAERSHGSTLRANISLLENNARVASEIAAAIGSHI